MGVKTNGKNRKAAQTAKKRRILLVIGAIVLFLVVLFAISMSRVSAEVKGYQEKIALLRQAALTEETRAALGDAPAGEQAKQAVFISVCDTENRASVFTGVGATLDAAWKNADSQAQKFVKEKAYNPVWVKADVVFTSEVVDTAELARRVIAARHEFFRYGVAFDAGYKTALLEAEMNGAKVYGYDDREDGLDFDYLNNYLRKAGRTQLSVLPDSFTLFQTYGWLCDEDQTVYPLISEGLDYGRRNVELIDADYVKNELLLNAGAFLVNQVNEDGSFVYGMYPRFDNDIDNYNIVRHASTLWSMACLYRVTGDESLRGVIEKNIEYMKDYIIYSDDHTAYLYEEKSDEIKLGGCGVAVIAMSEFMNAFQCTDYVDLCRDLGNGILTMLNLETGEYYHVLDGDFEEEEEFRTVYYDGEATFALCRLYGMTGEEVWLDAAKAAVKHFIEADYTQYKDHWIAYAMNEMSQYVGDPEYYTFALRNAQENLREIYARDTTYHTYLEMLMASFELYDRMVTEGIESDYLNTTFSLEELLRTIYTRANRMLNGFFYPEYAMYMANPQRILNTFMVRHDGYRVRIDDVQHNIGAFYKYYQHYDKMVEYGLLEARDQ